MRSKKKKIDNVILSGGEKDDRLQLLENNMTKYGCSPTPYPHLSYSSCTASTIGLEAFTHIREYYQRISFSNVDIYAEEFQHIRDDLRNIIGLNDNVDICLASSGTDLEMLPYLFVPKDMNICNIIIGPNEVGSGTLLSAEGRVFSNINEQYAYHKSDKLEGFDEYNIDLFSLPVRDGAGRPIKDEVLLDNIVNISKSYTWGTYKILHSVFHTKTGLIKPTPESLLDLADEHTIVIVDACQFRVSKERINQLLDRGCIVFITGSKFYGGPTFSAAALIPSTLRDIAAYNQFIPKGLNFLYGRELFPRRWKSVDNFEYGESFGLLLRWKAAVFEMQLFNSISKDKKKKTIKIFNMSIKKILKEYPEFVLLSDLYEDAPYDVLMSNSILTFGFKNHMIDYEMSRKIYQKLISQEWLNDDFPYSIHLGQPVKMIKKNSSWLGTLRIALDSRFFVNYSGKVQSVQEDLICRELEYIFKAIKIEKKSL